jgi:sugar lactone lactonase YvrE
VGAGNPLLGWRVDREAARFVGHGLQRPECILAEADGTLWSADARGGVVRIGPDGEQQLILADVPAVAAEAMLSAERLVSGTLPNGLAFAANGDILIANFGTDRLERMTRQGGLSVLLDSIEGHPIGKVNFVLRDRLGRLWLTVSTRINPWTDAIRTGLADGQIILVADGRARIVADGISFANEIRFDAAEEWLYVAETTAKRVTRFRVQADGSLTDRQIHGPPELGPGLVDGIAFDAFGNLWATMIFADRLVAITPEGELLELMDDGDPEATARFEEEFASGRPVPTETLMACGGRLCPWLASLTFGGADLSTVYLGSLRGERIPYFRSPVPGLPMIHWAEGSTTLPR